MEAKTTAEQSAMARSAREQRTFERKEVAAHYEHDPEIFSMVLDSRLTYSTGIYVDPDDDLETAQERKFNYIRALLDVNEGEKVFDAGCGWGNVMLEIAEHTGGHVHGVTLSEKQRDEALRRAREKGVADRIRIDLRHLEDVDLEPESVDVVIFVGSIVHMHNREAIYQWVEKTLRPGGRLFISDCFFPTVERGPRGSAATDFILSKTLGYCRLLALHEELGYIEQAGLDIRLVEDHTASYVRTVGHWIDNIRRNRERINRLAPGFAHELQCYMTVGRTSFARRTALEYMILASKGPTHGRLPDRALLGGDKK